MSKRVCLQAGHLNIKTNCNPALRGSTGAGGEVQINEAVRDATAEILERSGVEVKKVDANFNCDPTSADEDYDLFLALHCDMDYAGDGGSGFCDFPEPSTDGATERSQKLAKSIEASFFPAVGINIKSRSNANTRYYYMWDALSLNTPCVLIEMGQVKDPHDAPILQDTARVSKALANAILIALGVVSFLDEDISTSVEEYHKLKDVERYSKYWTYNDLISDWVKMYGELVYNTKEKEDYKKEARDLREVTKSQANEIAKLNKEIESLNKANAEHRSEIASLQAQFAEVSRERDTLLGVVKDYEINIPKLNARIKELEGKLISQDPLKDFSAKDLLGAFFNKIFKRV